MGPGWRRGFDALGLGKDEDADRKERGAQTQRIIDLEGLRGGNGRKGTDGKDVIEQPEHLATGEAKDDERRGFQASRAGDQDEDGGEIAK